MSSRSSSEDPIQDIPQDLSMKTARKAKKPIPPPLDLNARTLDSSSTTPLQVSSLVTSSLSASNLEPSSADLRTSKSPNNENIPRECLPIRKRPLLEVRKDLHNCKSPKSAGPNNNGFPPYPHIDLRAPNTAPSSPLGLYPHLNPHHLPIPQSRGLNSSLALTPSSANSLASANSAFTHFPVPPLMSIPKSPYLAPGNLSAAVNTSGNGYPTPPTDLHSPYPWPSPTALMLANSPFSPHSPLPFAAAAAVAAAASTAILSPAPSSYPSSTNSSREDLPIGQNNALESDSKRRFLQPSINSRSGADSSSPVSSSPLLSPRPWMPSGLTAAWHCFLPGTLVRFLLPDKEAPWQTVEELAKRDREASYDFHYAPHGLTVIKLDVISRESSVSVTSSIKSSDHGSAFTPVDLKREEASGLLRLRMAPHLGDKNVELIVECSVDHPFFIKDKGWCSVRPRLTTEKYKIQCQELTLSDICLPPSHPLTTRTPDLSDRLRRFEFDDPKSPLNYVGGNVVGSSTTTVLNEKPSSSSNHVSSSGGVKKLANSTPPPSSSSPIKKKDKDTEKPKRPMNGFMLFAKKYRLELIQQHPGKDNRAISVLLGEAWKSLPQEEREQYSQKAKVMADEQKKLHPDCWKRKRTLNASQNPPQSQQQQQHAKGQHHHQHHHHHSQHVHSMTSPTSSAIAFPSFVMSPSSGSGIVPRHLPLAIIPTGGASNAAAPL